MLVFLLVTAGFTGGYGHRNSYPGEAFRSGTNTGFTQGVGLRSSSSIRRDDSSVWLSTDTVPDKLARVPDQTLDIVYRTQAGYFRVKPNDTLFTQQVLHPPEIDFYGEPGALYTYILRDNDIPLGIKFWHWMVNNVPGGLTIIGDENISYLPPLNLPIDPETFEYNRQSTETHRYLLLAYKQSGPIQVEDGERQVTCDETYFAVRTSIDRDEFVEKYNLEGPVAGTFFRIPYSGQIADDLICQNSKCLGEPWPIVIPGVNDRPQCKK